MTMTATRKPSLVPWIGVAVLVLYFATYYWIVEPVRVSGPTELSRVPDYDVFNPDRRYLRLRPEPVTIEQRFFAPAHSGPPHLEIAV